MADWAMVAAIVAVITIPLYASPLLLGPGFRMLRECISGVIYRKWKCEAISWQQLGNHQLPGPNLYNGSPRPRHCASRAGVVRFCERVWGTRTQMVERPRYLRLEMPYLRIDADLLTAALILDNDTSEHYSLPSTGAARSTFIIGYGSVTGTFRRHEGDGHHGPYLVGCLRGFPLHNDVQPQFRDLSKTELSSIARGYPPFYRSRFKTHSGAEVPHPIRDTRDVSCAGWVVAIGFSSHSPTRLYNSRYRPDYEQACRRVLYTLESVLAPAFASSLSRLDLRTSVQAAVRAVAEMNRHRLGSVLNQPMQQAVFGAAAHAGGGGGSPVVGSSLGVVQMRQILDLFNDYGRAGLTDIERGDLEAILPEVLKAAVAGVHTWWQYVNNEGCAIPGWLLDEGIRRCPIWIEDRVEGPEL